MDVSQVCRWVSTKPGMTMSRSASITCAPSADRFGPTSAIVSPSTRMSARGSSPSESSWVSTVAPRMRIRSLTMSIPFCSVRVDGSVKRANQRLSQRATPSPAMARSCSATRAVSRSAPSAAIVSSTRSRLPRVWGIGTWRDSARSRIEPQVLAGQPQREADRRGVGGDEVVALVAHERGARRRGDEEVVGHGAVDAGPLGQHQRLGQRLVEAEDEDVDRQLQAGAGSQWTDVHDPRRQLLEAPAAPAPGPPPLRRP